MSALTLFITIVLLSILVPAMLPAIRERSWKRFGIALVLSFFIFPLPLFVYGASAVLVPDWKGGCPHGWLDCFHLGKLALAPLVLLAIAALYALEVYRVQNRNARWIVVGTVLGAMVASICFVYGLVFAGVSSGIMALWLLVPGYAAIWYGIRAAQLLRSRAAGDPTGFWALAGSAPFWAGAWVWSHKIYQTLPDKPPDCFVVTAALRGHGSLVGPFVEVIHNEGLRPANRQLLTLWGFEAIWRQRAPRSHKIFRRIYNRTGPVLAKRITSPWLADAAYLMIKPVELAARLWISGSGRRKI